MTSTYDGMMSTAFSHISDAGDCGKVKSFMRQMYISQHIRNAPIGGYPADTHHAESVNATTPDWRAAIHIDMGYESYYPPTELADTIAHEGFHAYFNNDDNPSAVAFAGRCIV